MGSTADDAKGRVKEAVGDLTNDRDLQNEGKADQAKAYGIMGADVKQTGEQFGKSAAFLRWSDAEGNKKFFAGDWQAFSAKAADLLLEIGLIKAKPDLATLVDIGLQGRPEQQQEHQGDRQRADHPSDRDGRAPLRDLGRRLRFRARPGGP